MEFWINHGSGGYHWNRLIGGTASYYVYIYGVPALIDAEKEWASDGSTLYFHAPGSVDPSGKHVEAKTRQYVIN